MNRTHAEKQNVVGFSACLHPTDTGWNKVVLHNLRHSPNPRTRNPCARYPATYVSFLHSRASNTVGLNFDFTKRPKHQMSILVQTKRCTVIIIIIILLIIIILIIIIIIIIIITSASRQACSALALRDS